MTLYRSLVVGLLGACLYLVATRHDPQPAPAERAAPTVIDVSPQLDPMMFGSLIRLDAGEHITGVERHAGWLDTTVEGVHGERRVLILLH